MGHRKTAIAVLLAAVAVTLVCVFDRDVLHFLGWDGQTSDNYAAWSGSVPAFISAAGLSSIAGGMWHHLNCGAPGCLWFGRYPDSRGVKWCWRHHPDHKDLKPTLELLHRLHHEHVRRQAPPQERM